MTDPGPQQPSGSLAVPGAWTAAGDRLRQVLGRAGSSLLEGVIDLAYPATCAMCGGLDVPTAVPVCRACRDRLTAPRPACPRCALPVGPFARLDRGCSECRGRSLGFDGAIALGSYQDDLRAACILMKHVREGWRARWLGEMIVATHAEALRGLDAGCVVPVPLHWWRFWSRGYNQAEALAAPIARALGLSLREALRRPRRAEILPGASRTERLERMRHAFRARRGSVPATVILVDDVMTTGATCGNAARALKAAGARRVIAVVLARRGPDPVVAADDSPADGGRDA